ncbi:polysaccharide deacetylase family protein [Aquibacillus koreensis]|uniref:Polysaccharide deacetylase family protein n=1 Tax=Aquibacillus koreensis TaxID=279446 RepID=A0A9X4AGQ7_9BACI|nr:polysaccharide deacetylase family protein [Aquibacillus koreensis]MCT2537483.1 polysaccharide deacetylase family protein [Aquibacillus koreensis]MDC3418929.1 polysaccharide deacetylase family protein [Aquibacillus koreensis]
MKKLIGLILVICFILISMMLPKEKQAFSATYVTHATHAPHEKSIDQHMKFVQAITYQQLLFHAGKITKEYVKPPKQWGLSVDGVKQRLDTDDRVIALTFDACGSETGNGIDQDLIDFLIAHDISATLFFNKRWIDHNKDEFIQIASNDQFQIENHGTHHKPLSVNGQQAYGINGTSSPQEVIAEVMENYQTIYQLTGIKSRYFRSGTAHYDEVSVSLLQSLGMEVVNFDINGDAGATYSANQVKQSLLQAQPGSIAIMHMNQPDSGTAEGVKMAVPLLQKKGFHFVKLEEYPIIE